MTDKPQKNLTQGCADLMIYFLQKQKDRLIDQQNVKPLYDMRKISPPSWKPWWETPEMRARYEPLTILGADIIDLKIDHLMDEFIKDGFLLPKGKDAVAFLSANRSTPRKSRNAIKQAHFVIDLEKLVRSVFY